MAILDRVARLLPAALTARLARHAALLSVAAVALVVLTAVAVASLVSPGAVGITALRVSDTVDLGTALASDLEKTDRDKDGLSDAFENYLYGTSAEDWNSSGTGIPDGWLAQHRQDPLSPIVHLVRGAAPPPDALPPAYADGYPETFTPPLEVYYNYGKPETYVPGVDDPWWKLPGARIADPFNWDQTGKGLPTGWLLHYGLDPQTVEPDRVAPGSLGNLTVRQAFEHDTDPLKADSDADGLTDWIEIHATKTDPSRFSTSGTGIADGWLEHFGLGALDPNAGSQDPDKDGVTNLEEFVLSYETYRAEIERDGLALLYTRGLHPLDWQTARTGIPDGWYVRYGLSPFGADVERVVGRASEWPEYRTYVPEGRPELPDLVMTVRDAYTYGRPSDWDEATKGVWWGGTNPVTLDSDDDGIPDPVEIRGWYANVTTDTGPEAKPRAYLATSNPLEADSDGDGLTDVEEYRGRATCGTGRSFPPTDPRNRDTAFSGLTDLEKVCGVVRDDVRYDLHDDDGVGANLDPTRADSAGDLMRDGARLDFWHDRFAQYRENPRYPYAGSAYKTVFDWTEQYARFAGMANEDALAQFRPDGDVDGDGIANVLDADPSGGLHLEAFPEPGAPKSKVFFAGGPEIDPTLYRLTEYASPVPHAASDPANPDTDGDGLPDAWETRYGRFSPVLNGWDLDPSKQDSDADGVLDGDANNDADVVTWYAYERRGTGTTRTANTFDFTNVLELLAGTNPNEVSSTGDGVPDGWKAFWGSRIADGTYPNLVAAGDARIGGVALERLGDIEAAMSASPIQPQANLQGLSGKATGYVRVLNVTGACSAESAEVKALLRQGERVALQNPCFTGQNLDGREMKAVRVEGVAALTYRREAELRTNPFMDDTDGDRAPDAYEAFHMVRAAGGTAYPDPALADGDKDPDADGIGIADECNGDGRTCGAPTQRVDLDGVSYGRGADPNVADSDMDGIQDGIELIAGLDPLDPSDVDSFRGDRDTDCDGVADYLELSGWGKSEFDARLRTDPKDPDSDDDGLLDGSTRNLDPRRAAPVGACPSTDANIAAFWNATGIAHRTRPDGTIDYLGEVELASSLRQELGTPSRPDDAFSVHPSVPDGWYGYYRSVIQNVRAVDVSTYEQGKPAWWREGAHGVWWWGRPPTVEADHDLDNDGLHDLTGEDAFPTLADDRIVHGAVTLADPRRVEAFVEAGANATDVRARAQRAGDGAGDPEGARAAAFARAGPNGVPLRADKANVAVTGLELPAGTIVTKGVAFPVIGQVVLDEREGGTANGALLEGTADARVGVRNRTVLVGFFGPHPGRIVGVGVTDADGRFNVTANVTTDLVVDVPTDIKPYGWYNGSTLRGLDPGAVAAGTTTGAERNRVVAWVLNTSPLLSPTDPVYGSWKAWLPKQGGSEKTTHATAFAVSAPIDVIVRSDTRITTTVPPIAENGRELEGEIVLKDASGAPLADRLVRIRWEGAASPIELTHLSTDRNGAINLTRETLPVSVPAAGERALIASFVSTNEDLRGTTFTQLVAIRQPTRLVATPDRTSIVVGESLVVGGGLLIQPPGGGAASPVAGATVRVVLGGATETARTDDRGNWSLRLTVPGTLAPGETALLAQFDGSPTESPVETSVPLAVKRTSTLSGLNRLEGPRSLELTLRGRLVDNEGQGFAGPIHVEAAGLRVATGAANDKGEFAVNLHLGRLALGAQQLKVRFPGDAGHAPSENFTQARVTSSTTLRLDGAPTLLVRGGEFALRGTLLDDAGQPIAQQPVTLHWRGEPIGAKVTDARGRFETVVRSNATERPALVPIAATYVPGPTSVYQPGFASADVRVVQGVLLDVAPDSVRRGNVAFRGTLFDDEGRPIPAAPVAITLGGLPMGETRTARNGSFELVRALGPEHPLGPSNVTATYPGTTALSGAKANATWLVRTPIEARLTLVGPFVRSETAPLEGRVVDDHGVPVDAPLSVSLGGVDLGTIRATQGVLKGSIKVPADLPRGEATLVLTSPGSDTREPYRLELDVVVKARPKVSIELPLVAVRGFSFAGDVKLQDDEGAPLRNTTFVYVLGRDGSPTFGQTDAEGRATLASVAPLSGDTFVALTVKGSGDLVSSEYRTSALRVVGPATPVGYAALVIGVLVVLAIAALVVVAVVLRRRQIEEVRDILDEAIRDLLAGNEYAGTIFLAYRRLGAHLARHGFAEKAHETPREFALGVKKAVPVGGASLKSLIRLFEEARYSDHAIGSRERDEAVRSLSGVRGELDRVLGKKPKEVAA